MNESQLNLLKDNYLEEHVFNFLRNLHNGFDEMSVAYFCDTDFEQVLNRLKDLGLGVFGIEPLLNGEDYGVASFDDYGTVPEDPNWYFAAFNKFKLTGHTLFYAANYHVPEHLIIGNQELEATA